MKERKTFADIIEQMNLFPQKEILRFKEESIQKDISLTSVIIARGLATRPMLSNILQKNKFELLLGELLIETGTVKPSIVQQALNIQKTSRKTIGAIIENMGFISHENLIETLCSQLNIIRIIPEMELVNDIHPVLAEKFMYTNLVFPYLIEGKEMTILMANPFDNELINHLKKFYPKYSLTISYVPKIDLLFFFDSLKIKSFSTEKDIGTAPQSLEVMSNTNFDESKDLSIQTGTLNILKLYLKKAIDLGASDIHFEPLEHSLRIRFAISGNLRVITHLPKTISGGMVNAIKAAGGMDIASHRLPDDGRFEVKYTGIKYSLRVSTYPCVHGENCVIRVLKQNTEIQSLESLGLSPANIYRIMQSMLTPSGIILSTGPTGVGKTTTIYSLLQQLLVDEKHIITFEDPIEFTLDGATQATLNEKAGFTFDTALPAIMRQNPDVIMVGEVRDKITANAIIRAALTGHKVLSTIHTETTTSTLNRLLKMGVENFLLYETIDLIIAQRLVRILCPSCHEEYTPPESFLRQLKIPKEDIKKYAFRKSTGNISGVKCRQCDGTGYNGQTAVHEIFTLNSDIARAMAEEKSIREVREIAMQRAGMITLREDCLYKIYKGITTIEECLRVTPDLDEPSRPLKTIIGLSEKASDFFPCDFWNIELGQNIIQRIVELIKNRPQAEIEKMMLTKMNEAGLKIKFFHTFSFTALDDPKDSAVRDGLKKSISQKQYCTHPLDENARCHHCEKTGKFIIPLLEINSQSLSELVTLADEQQLYIFFNQTKNSSPDWKLLFTELAGVQAD